jgi:hypothetical protein
VVEPRFGVLVSVSFGKHHNFYCMAHDPGAHGIADSLELQQAYFLMPMGISLSLIY